MWHAEIDLRHQAQLLTANSAVSSLCWVCLQSPAGAFVTMPRFLCLRRTKSTGLALGSSAVPTLVEPLGAILSRWRRAAAALVLGTRGSARPEQSIARTV